MVIVSNVSANPISGTFAGLPEGATILIKGVQHRISYVGGSGNDVTLTALTGTPRRWDAGGTGTSLNWTNPINWEGDEAPRAGDDLIFPAGVAGVTINNYAASTIFSSVRHRSRRLHVQCAHPCAHDDAARRPHRHARQRHGHMGNPARAGDGFRELLTSNPGLLSFTTAAAIATNGHLLTVDSCRPDRLATSTLPAPFQAPARCGPAGKRRSRQR